MIPTVLELGADTIVWLQQFQGWLPNTLLRAVSALGGMGYLFLAPLLLWCVDRRLGLRVLLLMALTLYVNTLIKELVALPRPFQVDPRVVSQGEYGYSFPSGHAQLVVVFWGMIAHACARRAVTVLALAMIFLTGLSRVYLGVHYPSDVISGWALGALMLWLWLRWEPAFHRLLETRRQRVLAVLGVAGGLALISLAVGAEPMLLGCVGFGLAVGLASIFPSRAEGSAGTGVVRNIGRYVLGMAATLLLIQGLTMAVGWSPLPPAVNVLVALALLGAVVAAVLPGVFQRLRI